MFYRFSQSPFRRLAAVALLSLMIASVSTRSLATETITFKSDKTDLVNGIPQPTRTVTGEILLEAQDGGVMLQSDDGRIWTIQPEQVTKRESDNKPLVPLTADQIANRMKQEMPPGFSVYQTAHYVIVHNTTDAYVRQVGALFERLYGGFYTFWKNQRWELSEPRFPLVALVLANRDQYLKHAAPEIGPSAELLIGYYHLSSNRMTTSYLPNLERSVSTIIHEATHQLAYNCGIQQRFADNPKWVSEGMAMFFESPNLKSFARWRGVGRVNQVNLIRWRKYLSRRPVGSLASLVTSDDRLDKAETALDAYGESWALTYYLLKTKRKEYVAYLKKLSQGKPKVELTGRERIEMFEQTIGKSLPEIDRGLVAYMRRVR